jgi:hypothetical protein
MASVSSVARPTTIPQPTMTRTGRTLVVLLALLGIGALAGGVALVSKPDGSVMQLPLAYLAGSPFADFLIPGLILGGLFGIGSFVVAALCLRGVALSPYLAFAVGCGQMIWITVELAIIREFSILHPICFGIGLAIALSSASWGWPGFRAWRAAR